MMVPCWHRPEMVNVFVNHMERTPCDYAEIIPYFVLSPEDADYNKLVNITAGYDRTSTVNTPLGRKKNIGLQRASALEWDYFMDMGSDDVYSPRLWDYLKPFLIGGEDYFGILNTHSYNPYLHKAVFLKGYHINLQDQVTAQGQGRCIRRDVVEKCIPLWDDTAPFGMDGYSDERITSHGYTCKLIDNGEEPLVCQIKGDVCLTAWAQFEDVGMQECNADWVVGAFNLGRELCFELSGFDDFHSAILRTSNETKNKERAFNLINEAHRIQTGELKYSSYVSYRQAFTRIYKKY